MHVKDAPVIPLFNITAQYSEYEPGHNDINNKWKKCCLIHHLIFFMDEKFQSLYNSELQLKKSANVKLCLTLLIVPMGVFGVVTFTLSRSHKEIAVRRCSAQMPAALFNFF